MSIFHPPMMASVLGKGGGSAPYHASAVHFDGATFVETASLTATDSIYAAFSLWVKLPQSSMDASYQILGPGSGPPVEFGLIPASDGTITLNITSTGAMQNITIISNPGAIVADTWVNMRGDANLTSGVGHLFAGVSDVTLSSVLSGSFTYPWSGSPFGVPDTSGDDYPIIGDMADVWVAATHFDMSFASTGANFITAGGKPKNPSGFPSAAMLFSGNKDTFPTNQGTGGAFTTTGSLTNASTSPSD